MKVIQNSKVVTVQDLARQTGVKISAANAFLKQATIKVTVKKVGGYSGHYLYQVISS
jgi:small subunit ribosomal protein S25e